MSETTIHSNATHDAIVEAITRLPHEATGGGTAARALMTRIGMTVLSRIKRAFVVKARGGTDDAGDRWAPLAPYTIAMRGARTKAERARRMKNFDKYSNRTVEILRDTGMLLNSLTPGSASPHQVFNVGPGSVIIGTNRAGAADHHEGRPERGLPQRRLWPDPRRWPETWRLDILEQAQAGVVDVAAQLLRETK